jgi:HK97 family phage portal protein
MVALSFWQHWFDRSFQRKSSSLESLPSFLYAPESKSGIPINWRSALDVTTVLGCCRVLAEGVSQVPLKVYRPRAGGGADPATDHWSYDLLYRKPNPWQTSFEFRETIMFHLALCFNAFIFKNVVGSKIKELIPIEPGRVFVTQNSDMTLAYTVTMPQGQQVKLTQKEIWHIRGPSWNSWMGLDAVKMAREAIGLAAALEATQASFQKNNMQPSGVYAVEGTLTSDQHSQLSTWLGAALTGSDKAGIPLVLDRSAEWTPLATSGKDAQALEQRKHQVEEICRAARVFPQMVGHNGDSSPTFASAEQFFTAHVVHSLGPWYQRIEQSIDVNLLADEPDGLYARHTVLGLLRGDLTSQIAWVEKALGGARPETAFITRNEARDLILEWNPIDGGDVLPQAVIVPPKAPDATPEPQPAKAGA